MCKWWHTSSFCRPPGSLKVAPFYLGVDSVYTFIKVMYRKLTRKPCYRKETARCRSCSFRVFNSWLFPVTLQLWVTSVSMYSALYVALLRKSNLFAVVHACDGWSLSRSCSVERVVWMPCQISGLFVCPCSCGIDSLTEVSDYWLMFVLLSVDRCPRFSLGQFITGEHHHHHHHQQQQQPRR